MENVNRIINLGCNLVCCCYFGYVAYLKYKIFSQEFELLDLLVFVTCGLLLIIVLFRPVASGGKFDALQIAICSGSKLYYLLFEFKSESIEQMYILGEILFIFGIIFWIFSILWLGRSFSILPSIREIKVNGPYGVIRHPIYFSYIVIDFGLLFIFPSSQNLLIILLGVFLYIWRIKIEEKLLSTHQLYSLYLNRVKFKLIPGIY